MDSRVILPNWRDLSLGSSPLRAAAIIGFALIVSACRAPQPAEPTAVAPSATAAASPLATVPAPTLEPTAVASATVPAPGESFYPPDTRTGIEIVDQVIEAFLAGDREQLRSLVHYTVTGCTHADGLGGPPKCEADQAEGTQVEVFPVLGPEGTFVERENIAGVFPEGDYALYAVYRVGADAEEYDYWPAGDFGVVFVDRAEGGGLTILVDEAEIVRINYTFPGQDLIPGRGVGGFILGPIGAAGSNSFDVPEARLIVTFTEPGRFVRNGEASRRGSFVSYDFVPEAYEPPYLKEIQFFSEESIRAFNEACQASQAPCFFGDYPDLDRYYRQLTAYAAGANVDGSDTLQTNGRRYYVTNRPCEGDACIIREYTTFARDVKVDVWVLLAAESQAEAADQVVWGLVVQEY